jgi:hypothetical protein
MVSIALRQGLEFLQAFAGLGEDGFGTRKMQPD